MLTLRYGQTHREQIEQCDQDVLGSAFVSGAPLLIAFGSWNQFGPGRFEWWSVADRVQTLTGHLNLILLRDRRNRWYQHGVAGLGADVQEAAQALRHLIGQIAPSHVVTLGASMGAHAAIAFGTLIGATSVLAFGPLAFLDAQRARALGEWRWLEVMDSLACDPTQRPCADLAELLLRSAQPPEVHVVYGHAPEFGRPNLDPEHARLIGVASPVRLHSIAPAPHPVAMPLKRRGLLEPLILELLERDFAVFPGCQASDFSPRQQRRLREGWLAPIGSPASVPLETRFWISDGLAAGRSLRDIVTALFDAGWNHDVALEAVSSTHRCWQARQDEPTL